MLENMLLAAITTPAAAWLLLQGFIRWTRMQGSEKSEASPARLRRCCRGVTLAGAILSAGYSVPIHAWAGYTESWQFVLIALWTGFLVACLGYVALVDVSLYFQTAPFRAGLIIPLVFLGPWGPVYYVGRIVYLATRPRKWHAPASIPQFNDDSRGSRVPDAG